MRHYRFGTLARWTMQVAPGIIICVVVFVARPPSEWPALGGLVLLYVAAVTGFVVWVARDRHVDEPLRGAGSVVFVTQNVPGAIVHVERFLVPDVRFARGKTSAVLRLPTATC